MEREFSPLLTPVTMIHPPTPPEKSRSRSSLSTRFPGPNASKTEIKAYIRALLSTYPSNNDPSFRASAARQSTLSTLPSFKSIRSLSAKMTPTEMALSRIWFDGPGMNILVHVGGLRRELRMLGFENGTAAWLDGQISASVRRLGAKAEGRFWERKMDREEIGTRCFSWLCLIY